MDNGHQKDSISDEEITKKVQKDAELDKKIQALRKKNEALIQRYHEIEEDRISAEREGMAITSRKPKQESLTITVTKTPNEKRTVRKSWKNSSDSEEEEEEHRFTFSVANKMQLQVTMDSKVKGKKVPSKNQDCLQLTKDLSELSMEQVDHLFTYGRGRQMQIAVTVDQAVNESNQDCIQVPEDDADMSMEQVDHLFAYGRRQQMQIAITAEKVSAKKRGEALGNEQKKAVTRGQNKVFDEKGEIGSTLTLPEQEHIEYLKWKKEREKIDLERVARQKNSRGEWKRAWDVDKTENMFGNDSRPDDGLCAKKGDRVSRKLSNRRSMAENKGTEKSNLVVNEDAIKTVTAVSSNAKGRDRLTGRAQRWGSVEEQYSSYCLDGNLTRVPIMECKCSNFDVSGQQNTCDDNEKKAISCVNPSTDCPLEKNACAGHEEGVSIDEKWYIPLPEKQAGKCSSEGTDAIEYLSVLESDGFTKVKDESGWQLDKKITDHHNKLHVAFCPKWKKT